METRWLCVHIVIKPSFRSITRADGQWFILRTRMSLCFNSRLAHIFFFFFLMVRILISLFINLTVEGLPWPESVSCCTFHQKSGIECVHFDLAGSWLSAFFFFYVYYFLWVFFFFLSFVAQAHFKADFAYVDFSLLAI